MKSLTSRLATQATQASLRVREMAGADLHSPVCVFDVCDKLLVQVRFAEINSMEGMYYSGNPAKILIGARRPLPRRNFTCGHELGHHIFGHGSTIDELHEATSTSTWQPEEFLVNSFSAALLMPQVGLKRAFNVRAASPENATPTQLFEIACNFGVGYNTLVSHLTYGAKMIGEERARELLRTSPKEIRKIILKKDTTEPLIVVDKHWTAPTIDLEVGTLLLMPKHSMLDGKALRLYGSLEIGELFQAVSPGLSRMVEKSSGNSRFVRVSPFQFIGLSRYRHLEEDVNDEK